MKQFLSAVLFLLISTALMAQNTATTTQTGDGNGSDVNQTGTNEATVSQFGNLNITDVDQSGTNLAFVDQLLGDENSGTVNQVGASNQAYVVQGMVEDYYSPDAVTTNMPSSNNIATATQTGDGNLIDFLQTGNDNTGSITQVGNNNKGYAYQGWAGDWWGFGGPVASLYSNNGTANITQVGNSNNGQIYHYGGNGNSATIVEEGSSNKATIAQGFIYDEFNYDFTNPIYNVNNNSASMSQYGDNNFSKLFQLGDGNQFTLTQNGDGNNVGNSGPGSLEAIRNGYFAQDGNDNEFTGTQEDGATLSHESFQLGNTNKIDLEQGALDIALIQQTGDLNTANVYQYGGGQDATVLQNGNSNISTVTQQ